MLAIGVLEGRHFRILAQVVFTVGHAQAALQQVGAVDRRVGEVRRHPQAEQVVGVKVGAIERIDIRPHGGAQIARQGPAIGYGGDLVQARPDGREALGVDPILIVVGIEVVADLARLSPRGGVRGGLDQIQRALVGLVAEDREEPEGRTVRRNDGGPVPGAVGVGEEVVAGRDGLVHPGDVEAVVGRRAVRAGGARGEEQQGRAQRHDGAGMSHDGPPRVYPGISRILFGGQNSLRSSADPARNHRTRRDRSSPGSPLMSASTSRSDRQRRTDRSGRKRPG